MEDITLVNDNELNIALEAIEVHLANLDRVRYLYNEAMANGVNRVTMESLYSIYPDSVKETTHPYLFTIELSEINKEYAMEGFVEAIAEGIKWIFTQIIEIFKAIVKYLVQFCDWLSGEIKRRDKKKGYSYDYENIDKRADKLLENFNKAVNEVGTKGLKDDSKIANAIDNITKLTEEIKTKYNTKLDIAICNMESGYTQNDILRNADALSEIVGKQSAHVELIFKKVSDIITKGISGSNLHNELDRLDKLLKNEQFLLIVKGAYSYKNLSVVLSKYNGIPCKNLTDLAASNHAEVKYGINETRFDRNKNEIWGNRVLDGHGTEVPPINWNVGSDKIFTKYLDAVEDAKSLESNYYFNMNTPFYGKFKIESLSDKKSALDEIEKDVDTFKENSEKLNTEIEKLFGSKNSNDSKTTVDIWIKANKGNDIFSMVWPKHRHYISREDAIYQDIKSEGFTAEEVIQKLSYDNLGFWTTISKPIIVYSNGFKELPVIYKRIEELDDIKRRMLGHIESFCSVAEERMQEEKDKKNK